MWRAMKVQEWKAGQHLSISLEGEVVAPWRHYWLMAKMKPPENDETCRCVVNGAKKDFGMIPHDNLL